MAHAAVISLKQTLNRLMNSSPTTIVSSTRDILRLAYNHTTILQHALERFGGSSSSKRLLECEILDCARKLEDIIDFHELELESEIASFTKRVAKMAADYIEQLLTQPVDDDDATISSNVNSNVKMVGRSRELVDYKCILTKKIRSDDECPFFIAGEVRLNDLGENHLRQSAGGLYQDLSPTDFVISSVAYEELNYAEFSLN